MSELYDTDVYEWSRRQAALLRRRAAGEPINEAELDWAKIAEEIESVGSERLDAVEGLLLQMFVYVLSAEAWPLAPCGEKWRADARLFQAQAALRFVPSMRPRLDLDRLYAWARRAMPDTVGGQPPLPVLPTCPVTLDELLGAETATLVSIDPPTPFDDPAAWTEFVETHQHDRTLRCSKP